MSRLDAMLERLPPPFAIDEGSVVRDVVSLVEAHMQVFDEDLDRIQRTHWLGSVTDIGDASRLGALVGVAPAGWEPLPMFRARLQAEVAAVLSGSVTVAELTSVTERIVSGAREAFAMPAGPAPSIEEWPVRPRHSSQLVVSHGLVRPHDRVEVRNEGLDAVPANVSLIGVAGGATAMPVVVNWTTGRAVGWRGIVPAGRTLRLLMTAAVGADLDGDDVSDRLWSSPAFGPELVHDSEPRPLVLVRGDNTISIESLGRYDAPGTDHVAFGVTDPLLRQGRFAGRDDAGTVFDDSVFTTGPFASVDISWIERTPSVFDVAVEWGAVARVARRRTDPEGDRESLRALLQARIDRLRGAGVVGRVELRPLREVQASLDRVTVLSPAATQERASTGEDRLVATGAIFDETPRERGRLA